MAFSSAIFMIVRISLILSVNLRPRITKPSLNPPSGWNCKSNRTKIVLHEFSARRTLSMLRMGKMTDYATVVLASLAQEPDATSRRDRIGRAYTLEPARRSARYLKGLQRAGMVISSRGAQGGLSPGAQSRTNYGGADSRCVRGTDRDHRMQRRLQSVRDRAAVPCRRRMAAGECGDSPRTRGCDAASIGGPRFQRRAYRRPRLRNSREYLIFDPTIEPTPGISCLANPKKSKPWSARNTGTASSPISSPTACRRDSMRMWWRPSRTRNMSPSSCSTGA